MWEVATGRVISSVPYADSIYTVAFSPDGKYVISGSADGLTRIWEAATGWEIARMVQDGPVGAVAFSPDEKYVISGSADKTARVWLSHPDDLIADTCARLPRNLTRAEWRQYIRDLLPYQVVCLNLPLEQDMTPTP